MRVSEVHLGDKQEAGIPARRYTMAFVIGDDCIMCGSCADQCPASAISEGDSKYVIDQDVCVGCGSCAEQCPVSAIAEG